MTEEKSLRVLQVVDTLGMGGAETWLMEVLRLWSKNNTGRMDFLATSGNPGIFDDEARRLGARIHYVCFRRAHLPRFAKQFRRVLRGGRYHVIHDHQDYASGWHFLMGAGALPPVRVTHVHNPAYQIRNNYGVTLSRRLAAQIGKALVGRYASYIAGTSWRVIGEYGFEASRFRRIPKTALHCGFDPARFLGDADVAKASVRREFGWPEDSKIVLFVGRIDRSAEIGHRQNHKNSGFAVSVGIECARRDPRMCLLLAGAPSEPAISILRQRISEAGFADRIRFAGIRSDVARLMLAGNALLFPSRGEGLGMVAVEAQAAGLPVLASTAVPRECVVIPELVHFKDLDVGTARWADDLLHLTALERDPFAANRRVAASAFSIDHSAAALRTLYRTGRAP